MINLKDELSTVKKLVEHRLKLFFTQEKRSARKISPFLGELVGRIEEFTLRGSSKRLRAFLVFVGYEAVRPHPPRSVIDVAAGIELIHSYLLIHDDIIDDDDWRRGGQTVHKHFERYHRQYLDWGSARNFGVAQAIVAGDIAVCLASSLISESRLPDHLKIQVLDRLSRLLLETDYGQALDVFQGSMKRVRLPDAIRMYRYKTAKYSFETPLHLGALLAGAGRNHLRTLSAYAIPAGLAFQIQDDILGTFGTRKQIGKPVDSDIKEGKQTVLYIEALKRLPDDKRNWLENHYGKADLRNGQIRLTRRLFETCGALKYCQKKSENYLRLANKAINDSRQISQKSATILIQLSNYLASRNS